MKRKRITIKREKEKYWIGGDTQPPRFFDEVDYYVELLSSENTVVDKEVELFLFENINVDNSADIIFTA